MSRAFPDPSLPRGDGRVAVVTGANRGLGRAIALGLARLGHQVRVAARDRTAAEQVAAELRSEGLAASALVLDVADDASVAAAASTVASADILVNNAAILPDNGVSALDVPLDIVRRTLEVNTTGAIALMQIAAPAMRKRGYGRIVNVSSDWGSIALMASHQLAYRVSKAALNAATRVFADELKADGVLVNAMHPGWVRTEMGGPQALLEPEVAADTALWLATLPAGGPTNGFFKERAPHPW